MLSNGMLVIACLLLLHSAYTTIEIKKLAHVHQIPREIVLEVLIAFVVCVFGALARVAPFRKTHLSQDPFLR